MGKWVKASEELPKKEGFYTVRKKYCKGEEKAEYTSLGFTNYDGYIVVEWLDESIKPDSEDKIGKAIELCDMILNLPKM